MQDMKSIAAAQIAAAKVKAQLFVAKQMGGNKNLTSSSSSKSGRQNGFVTEEVDINNVTMSARNYLTRTATQDEIQKMSGAYISTRGRYLTAEEIAALPPNPSANQRPLFLHVHGSTEQDVKVAVGCIMNIILEHSQSKNKFESRHTIEKQRKNRNKFSRFDVSRKERFSNPETIVCSKESDLADETFSLSDSKKSVPARLGCLAPKKRRLDERLGEKISSESVTSRTVYDRLSFNAHADATVPQQQSLSTTSDVTINLSGFQASESQCVTDKNPSNTLVGASNNSLHVTSDGAQEQHSSSVNVSKLQLPTIQSLREKIYLPELVGVTKAEMCEALLGSAESNLTYIRNLTGALLELRGAPSTSAAHEGRPSETEALHFYLEHLNQAKFTEAKTLVMDLSQTVLMELQTNKLQQQQLLRQQQLALTQGSVTASTLSVQPENVSGDQLVATDTITGLPAVSATTTDSVATEGAAVVANYPATIQISNNSASLVTDITQDKHDIALIGTDLQLQQIHQPTTQHVQQQLAQQHQLLQQQSSEQVQSHLQQLFSLHSNDNSSNTCYLANADQHSETNTQICSLQLQDLSSQYHNQSWSTSVYSQFNPVLSYSSVPVAGSDTISYSSTVPVASSATVSYASTVPVASSAVVSYTSPVSVASTVSVSYTSSEPLSSSVVSSVPFVGTAAASAASYVPASLPAASTLSYPTTTYTVMTTNLVSASLTPTVPSTTTDQRVVLPAGTQVISTSDGQYLVSCPPVVLQYQQVAAGATAVSADAATTTRDAQTVHCVASLQEKQRNVSSANIASMTNSVDTNSSSTVLQTNYSTSSSWAIASAAGQNSSCPLKSDKASSQSTPEFSVFNGPQNSDFDACKQNDEAAYVQAIDSNRPLYLLPPPPPPPLPPPPIPPVLTFPTAASSTEAVIQQAEQERPSQRDSLLTSQIVQNPDRYDYPPPNSFLPTSSSYQPTQSPYQQASNSYQQTPNSCHQASSSYQPTPSSCQQYSSNAHGYSERSSFDYGQCSENAEPRPNVSSPQPSEALTTRGGVAVGGVVARAAPHHTFSRYPQPGYEEGYCNRDYSHGPAQPYYQHQPQQQNYASYHRQYFQSGYPRSTEWM